MWDCHTHQGYYCTSASAQELLIDATYVTNNSALNLYAVLAEHDRTSVLLVYLFVGNAHDALPVDSATAATTNIIEQFLRGLQSVNSQLNPCHGPSLFLHHVTMQMS